MNKDIKMLFYMALTLFWYLCVSKIIGTVFGLSSFMRVVLLMSVIVLAVFSFIRCVNISKQGGVKDE